MEFGKAFSFQFEDSDWIKKIVIMGLVTLIPIIGQLVLLGWMVDIIKKVIDHEPLTLPNLDFGRQLSRGWGVFVIGLVYAIPIIVVGIIQAVASAIVGGIAGNNSDMVEVAGVIVAILSICFGLLYLIYGIVLALVMPIAYGKYAEFGTIGSAIKFGEVISMARKVIGPLFIVLLGSIVASLVASLGSIACGVGVLLTTAYATSIMAHLYGQAYNLAKSAA